MPECAHCAAEAKKQCPCHQVHYCSTTCQKNHFGIHRVFCGFLEVPSWIAEEGSKLYVNQKLYLKGVKGGRTVLLAEANSYEVTVSDTESVKASLKDMPFFSDISRQIETELNDHGRQCFGILYYTPSKQMIQFRRVQVRKQIGNKV